MRLHNPFRRRRLIGRNGVILGGGRLRRGRSGKTLAEQLSSLTVPEAAIGVAGYAASYTPSLLPRPWYFQGLVAGIGAMTGYQFGLLAGWLVETVAQRLGVRVVIKPGVRRGGIAAGAAIVGAGIVAIPLRSISWHRATAEYVHHRGPNAFWAVASAGAASGIFWLFLGQWRLTLACINLLSRHLDDRLARSLVARLVSTLVVLATILVILDQVILRGVVGVAATASAQVDLRTPPNVSPPISPLHSGSQESWEAWESLGVQGKRFVCAGPSRERVAEVMAGLPAAGGQPRQPIRAYASMNGRTLPEVVDAVLAELDRTQAWTRRAILVVTSTGRGNVNEWSTSAFEYLMRGDCAVAAMQYSGLPSAVTMLSSKAVPVNASRMLFAAIEQRVASLPGPQRPKLYVAGESLGAFGSNGIFDGADDLLRRASGGVWTGCPGFTPLRAGFAKRRSPASTQVWPVVDGGRHVRFAMTADQFVTDPDGVPFGPWDEPRFVYLQNDTDPVVWWRPRLIWQRPDWINEMKGTDTPMGHMTWIPMITFWQLAADMPVCRSIGSGYGHKYNAEQCVPAWAGVLGLDITANWTPLLEALNADVPPVAP